MELKKVYEEWWSPRQLRSWENISQLNPRASLQKYVTNILTPFKTVEDWQALLVKKTPALGMPVSKTYWSNALKLLIGPCSGYCATSFFKTVFNSWTTSARYGHGDDCQCILGCPDTRDAVSHYFPCTHVRDALSKAFNVELSSDSALFGSESCVEVSHIQHVATMFVAYHSVKLGHAGLIWVAPLTGVYSPVRRAFLECSFAARSELAN